MSVTIKDIAKVAGVSHTTVSRALNNSPLIKDETKVRIQKIAKELNYVPDRNARALVNSRSNNIGLFFSSLTEGTTPDFFQEVVRSISRDIHKDYNLVINSIDTYKNYNEIDKRNYAGIILVSQSKKDDDFIRLVMDKDIPIVVINRLVESLNVMNILCDDEEGVYKGVRYLVESGHTKIGFISGREDFDSSIRRKRAYIQALNEDNLSVKSEYMVSGDYTLESGYNSMEKLINLTKPPTAVFCANDDMAFGAIRKIQDMGLKVPEDIAIMGFDNSIFSSYTTPPLTTIKRPVSDISSKAIGLLLEIIHNKTEIINEKIYMPSTLILRKST